MEILKLTLRNSNLEWSQIWLNLLKEQSLEDLQLNYSHRHHVNHCFNAKVSKDYRRQERFNVLNHLVVQVIIDLEKMNWKVLRVDNKSVQIVTITSNRQKYQLNKLISQHLQTEQVSNFQSIQQYSDKTHNLLKEHPEIIRLLQYK